MLDVDQEERYEVQAAAERCVQQQRVHVRAAERARAEKTRREHRRAEVALGPDERCAERDA